MQSFRLKGGTEFSSYNREWTKKVKQDCVFNKQLRCKMGLLLDWLDAQTSLRPTYNNLGFQ